MSSNSFAAEKFVYNPLLGSNLDKVLDTSQAVSLSSDLTVAGNAYFDGDLTINGTCQIDNDLTLTGSTSGLYVGDGNIAKFEVDKVNIDSGTLYVNSTNNRVGIGTTSPVGLLHVGVGTTAPQALFVHSITGNVGIGTTGPWKNLVVRAETTPTVSIGKTPALSFNLAWSTTDAAAINTDGHNCPIRLGPTHQGGIFIDTTTNLGKVGINDTTPDAKLDVEGDCIITSDLTLSGGVFFLNGIAFPPTAPADDQIIKYDAALGRYAHEADAGGAGGGDNVTVNASAVDTTANLLDGTDITWTLTDGGAGGPDDITGTVVDDSHNHVYSNIDATTSANWANQISDETGTGVVVFGTSPTFTTGITVPADSISDDEIDENATFEWTNTHYHTGNVGIGVSAPAQKLDVVGSVQLSQDLTLSGAQGGIFFDDDTYQTTAYIYEDIDFNIFAPDGVNDEIAIFHVDADKYPSGIKLINVQITLPSDAAYSMVFEEWAGDPPVAQNDIETVTTGATDSYMEVLTTGIDDSDIDTDDYIFLHVPATDVDWIHGKVIFYKK